MVRKAVNAELADDWPELTRNGELNPWMTAKLKESHYQARQGDGQRAPVQGQGGVTLSYVFPHRHRYPFEHYIWWVSMV